MLQMDTEEIARYLEAVAQYEAGGELGSLVDRLDSLFLEYAKYTSSITTSQVASPVQSCPLPPFTTGTSMSEFGTSTGTCADCVTKHG